MLGKSHPSNNKTPLAIGAVEDNLEHIFFIFVFFPWKCSAYKLRSISIKNQPVNILYISFCIQIISGW